MPFVRNLKSKILLGALAPMILVLILVAFTAFQVYGQVTQGLVMQRDTELARVGAARLSEGLGQPSRLLQDVAAEDDVRSLEPARLRSALEEAQSQLALFDAGVVGYDVEGIAIWPRRGTEFPAPTKLDEARLTLRPVFSDIFEDAISDQDVILVGVPIMDSDGEFGGVLVGLSSLRRSLLGTVFTRVLEFQAGRSGHAYLVDGMGRVIYHRYASQIGQDLGTSAPVMQLAEGETGAVLTEDETGEMIIAGFAPVPGTDWGIITQERWDVVVGPIRGYGMLFLGVLWAGTIVSGVLVFLSMSRVLGPIEDLTKSAQLIADGHFDRAVVVETGDEIETLARQFNAMAGALRDSFAERERRLIELREAEEGLKEYSGRLEEMVDERTRELREAQEELVRKEKLAVLGQLAGGLGHELRNPLGAIKNAAYFLNMTLEEPEPEVKQTLDILRKEVDTSVRIISSLLDFARAKAPARRKVDVNEVVREVLDRVAVPEGIEVVSQLDDALPIIMADPDQLEQVFSNIVLNAVQAMLEGGQLVIKSEARKGEPAHHPGWVAVSVMDTGVGIPEGNLEKLFEPLYTTKARGIGLGLAVVRTLLDAHGGVIEVESEVGKGSTFTVRLPCDRREGRAA